MPIFSAIIVSILAYSWAVISLCASILFACSITSVYLVILSNCTLSIIAPPFRNGLKHSKNVSKIFDAYCPSSQTPHHNIHRSADRPSVPFGCVCATTHFGICPSKTVGACVSAARLFGIRSSCNSQACFFRCRADNNRSLRCLWIARVPLLFVKRCSPALEVS